MVALPSQLFYNTMIPACLWFVARNKQNSKFRDRRGEILFIDARKLGVMVDRRHRQLTLEDVEKIAATYHAWKGVFVGQKKLEYADVAGFCQAVKIEDVRNQGYILTPGRYVGTEEEAENDELFEEEMQRLTKELSEEMAKARNLDKELRKNLEELGFGL